MQMLALLRGIKASDAQLLPLSVTSTPSGVRLLPRHAFHVHGICIGTAEAQLVHTPLQTKLMCGPEAKCLCVCM